MKRRRRLFWVLYPLFLLVLVELTCRVFWAFSGVPFFSSPNALHHYFYPEVVPVAARQVARDDGRFDVLLLGGSVIAPGFGDVDRKLEQALGKSARVHTVARLSHTSRDSLHKYRRLAKQRFDLVVFYHGINEARANNCPRELYRDDYSHWGWYRLVNAAEEGGERWLSLPYTLGFVWTKLGGKLGLIDLVPKHVPGDEWVVHGAQIKTDAAFRNNLNAIARIARERGEPLVVMTFATHLVPGYSREKFQAGSLGYVRPELPIELWGKPASVLAAVRAHNRVAVEVAKQEGVHLFDQARAMPADVKLYNDVCHLSPAGSVRFVENLVHGLKRLGLQPQ